MHEARTAIILFVCLLLVLASLCCVHQIFALQIRRAQIAEYFEQRARAKALLQGTQVRGTVNPSLEIIRVMGVAEPLAAHPDEEVQQLARVVRRYCSRAMRLERQYFELRSLYRTARFEVQELRILQGLGTPDMTPPPSNVLRVEL